MSGRHELPSKRSFYFSLATSTLRFAIVVVLVVGGIWVINSAFPEGSAGGGLPDAGTVTGPTAATGPTGTTGPTGASGPTGAQEPDLTGIPVAVRNGTSVSGLAGDTAAKLEDRYAMEAIQVDDAPQTVAITTIYYRNPDLQDDAEFLAQDFFKKIEPNIARLQAGEGVDPDVQIAIYLGTDYASTQS